MDKPVAVLIPVKAFNNAKKRLSQELDERDRSLLMQKMAKKVVKASGTFPVWVVCDDDEVADWATSVEASVIRVREPGLNKAIETGVDQLANNGFNTVIIAHADLPYAEDLTWCADFKGITIIQDRQGDGTPVLVIPTNIGFRFSYGPGSFAAHKIEAKRLGVPYRDLLDSKLSFDLDNPADLAQIKSI